MTRFTLVAVLIGLLLTTSARAEVQKQPASEKEKIEALIKHVEELQTARFVRNGEEYDPKTAAKFLRRKWQSNEASIKTAKDFIEKAASISSTSGKPYLIRFKDGTELKSADYLSKQLDQLESSNHVRPAQF